MAQVVDPLVVHGIADQRAGQTVRELPRLLCHGGEGPPRYVQGELHAGAHTHYFSDDAVALAVEIDRLIG